MRLGRRHRRRPQRVYWRASMWCGIAVLWSVGLTGCSGETTASPKHSTGVVRVDVAPLTKRWPFLGIKTARWMSGVLGDERAPGPSSYWIDAVITVSASDMSRLTTEFDVEPIGAPTDVEPQLQSDVPDATPVGSPQLDAATADQARGQVFLYPQTNTVVVVARFGN